MERKQNIYTGGELISNRSKIVRDLPVLGLKEFTPSGSWLEGKRISKSLEERYDVLKEERLEKISALNVAHWVPELKKAKVTKKVGKMWELFGHRKDDEDWLLAEEALYLLETNDLELFFGEVCLTVERSYTLLLDPANGCSVNEYRTFSYLLRNGYKLFRHSQDVTATQYEKQIGSHRCIQSQKHGTSQSSNHKVAEIEESEEISIIETDKEIIIINDSPTNYASETLEIDEEKISNCENESLGVIKEESNVETKLKSVTNYDIICIDDDDDETKQNILESDTSNSSFTDSEDVVYVCCEVATRDRDKVMLSTFTSIDRFLRPEDEGERTENGDGIIDLSSEEKNTHFLNRKWEEILNDFPCANKSMTLISTPDPRLIPENVEPIFNEYRVNLNVRPQVKFQYRHRPPYRRSFTPVTYSNLGMENSLMRRAQEMQVMAMGMLRVASTLINSAQNSQIWCSNNSDLDSNPPLIGAMETHKYSSTPGWSDINNRIFTGNYQRRYSGGGYGGHNSYFRYGRPVQRKNFTYNRNYSTRRGMLPHRSFKDRRNYDIQQRKEKVAEQRTHSPELVTIDTDDEDDDDIKLERELRGRVESDHLTPPKRIKTDSSTESDSNFIREKVLKSEPDHGKVSNETHPPGNLVQEEKMYTISTETGIESNKNGSGNVECCTEVKPEYDMNSDGEVKVVLNCDGITKMEEERHLNTEQIEVGKVVGVCPDNDSHRSFEMCPLTVEQNSAHVTNWEQYKKQQEMNCELASMEESFDYQPILRIEDTTNISNILTSLEIFGQFQVKDTPTRRLTISYDMFGPETSIRKSMKELPNYRIIILGYDEEIPSPSDLIVLQKDFPDDIPFLFAIVSEESIAFYKLNSVQLPLGIDN